MKKSFAAVALLFLTAAAFGADTNELALIPLPQEVHRLAGDFTFTARTRIYCDADSRQTAELLAARLRRATGYPLTLRTRHFSGAPVKGAVLLTTKGAARRLGPEGYELTVTPESVVIRAPAQAGLFYGTRTLLQLLPPEIFSPEALPGKTWRMPGVRIDDWPRFKWRGLMLDVARHFYTKQEVERLLDLMALYKLNRFHWHLTDDQGWRLEIPQYPRLTQIGAWRARSRIEPLPPKGANAEPPWLKPAPDKFAPDGRYGGFYTPQDIREVVAYAAARHITVVPEIEMPGHSSAALTAYPQFSCTGGPFSVPLAGGVFNGIYCPANEQTFQFLDNVLDEVFRLFPGRCVHIGGDEVPKDTWKNSAACQALMKREGLKNEEQLQSWFIRRMEKFINARGHTLIGWSEILQGGLATNAVVMDWIGGGREAAGEGHDVVMTPTTFCYFDHYQSTNHATEPQAIGGYLPLEDVYSFNPVPAGLPARFRPHILGAQANLWTEFIASLPYAEYMIFPRLCALAEVVWSPQPARNWEDFHRRLGVDERRLDELRVNYRHAGGI